MFKLLSFLLLSLVKLLALVFYTGQKQWLGKSDKSQLDQVVLLVFLNHTSLFEPLLLRHAPWKLIWMLSQKLVIPGADVTMKRPVLGRVLKSLMPGCIPISRKLDTTWYNFLSHVNESNLTAIAPEGRMMRRNGLDKFGKPMSVRGGVAEILQCLNSGKILFVYSGGLHHIQAPGDKLPNLFKAIDVNLELVDVAKYKSARMQGCPIVQENEIELEKYFKQRVIEDMNRRLKECVPKSGGMA